MKKGLSGQTAGKFGGPKPELKIDTVVVSKASDAKSLNSTAIHENRFILVEN
jgi:hypothetical protein